MSESLDMLQVRLLGRFEMQRDGQPVALPSRSAQALLAYLLLQAGAPARREQLAAVLWPDASESNARNSLRHALWRLRKALLPSGTLPDYFITDNNSMAWNLDCDYWLDTATLEHAAVGASCDELAQALAVYRGELLPGFEAEWVGLQRRRLEAVFAGRMQELLDGLAAAGRWTEVATQAERWIALGESHEPAYRALIRAHAAQGDLAAAAEAFRRCRESLARDPGSEPSEQTRDLFDQVRAARPATGLPPAAPSAPAAPVPPAPTTGLPTLNTAFVGRERELHDVAERLRDPHCRLLTLTGPGGIGKTRLAIQAAAQATVFADGAQFVRLSMVSRGVDMVSAIAEALRFSYYGGDDVIAQLLDYLRPKNLLLVLDNFEHLLNWAEVVAAILRSAPGVKALVTSQERLNIDGEWVLEIEGMPIPERDDLSAAEAADYGAVQLFAACARRVDANFRLRSEDLPHVLRICRLVAGMPLGIELAAAWLRSVSVLEIAQEIEGGLQFLSSGQHDLPERHRSLRAVFDHSWARLSPVEQRQFSRLAVFAGGFTREAAEQVAGATLADLSTLLDKSLLRRLGSGRFAMHGLLRDFALARLDESGEWDAVRARHLIYFLAVSETAETGLRGREQLEWLRRLDTEHDNLRRALAWSLETDRAAGQRLAGNLARFWYLRGTWKEGRDWLRALLAGDTQVTAPTDDAARSARAWALMGLGWLADEDGSEEALYQESLALCRAVGDDWGVAYSLRGLGSMQANDGNQGAAKAMLVESLAIFQAQHDEWGSGLAYYNLGWVAFDEEDNARAQLAWTTGLEHFRRSGDRWGIAVTLGALTYQARLRDEYTLAASLSEESLALFRALGDRAGIAMSLLRLAQIAFRRSNYDLAVTLIQESQVLQEAMGDQRGLVSAKSLLGLVRCYQGRYQAARSLLEDCAHVAVAAWGKMGNAFVLNYLGFVPYLQGQLPQAAEYWERASLQHRHREDKPGLALSLWGLGAVALGLGQLDQAFERLEYSLALFRQLNDRRYLGIVLNTLARAELARGQPQAARARVIESLVQRRYAADRQGLAEGFETLAELLATSNASEAEHAARLLGLAEGLRVATGAPLPPVDQAAYLQAAATVRAQMARLDSAAGAQTKFDAAWQAGRAMAQDSLDAIWTQALGPEATLAQNVEPGSPHGAAQDKDAGT